jgi:hypothetical protein
MLKAIAGGSLALVILAVGCGESAADYVSENMRIVESLPEMPGSKRVRVESDWYNECDPGYTTHAIYEAPPNVTAEEVVRFYIERMSSDWQYTRQDIPVANISPETPPQTPVQTPVIVGIIPGAHFTRAGATVSVSTDSLATDALPLERLPGREPSREFWVTVDSDGARERVYCD